jgi:parallel beta-helix repeat protein
MSMIGYGSLFGCLTLAGVATDAHAGPARPPLRSVQCGEVITESLRVANPLFNCPGNGLVVGAPNVTIDLGGHLIEGTGVDSSVGVDNSAGHAGVAIRDGILTDFGAGVRLGGASGNELSSLRVFRNIIGILLTTTGETEIRGCSARGNEQIGIRLEAGSNDNVLVDNDASENSIDGFYVEDSRGNTFASNRAEGNGTYGFEIFGASGNVFRANLANGNLNNGFTLDDQASDNLLKGNRAVSNVEQGVRIFSGTGNVLQKNTFDENGENGILSDTSALTLRGNRANRNGFVGGGPGDDAGLGISVPAGVIQGGNKATGNDDPNECEAAELSCHVP